MASDLFRCFFPPLREKKKIVTSEGTVIFNFLVKTKYSHMYTEWQRPEKRSAQEIRGERTSCRSKPHHSFDRLHLNHLNVLPGRVCFPCTFFFFLSLFLRLLAQQLLLI
jgi:hypothetical protein